MSRPEQISAGIYARMEQGDVFLLHVGKNNEMAV